MSSFYPDCSFPSKAAPKLFRALRKDFDKNSIRDHVESIVSDYCSAMVVDGEEIFNFYRKKPIRESVLDDIYKREIGKDAKTVLHEFQRDESTTVRTLEFYMAEWDDAYKYVITYKNRQYKSQIYLSKGYLDEFGDDFVKTE